MQPLTRRQREVLDFINEQIDGRGFPPSLREIAAHFGLKSINSVMGHLVQLEQKGWIGRTPRTARAIKLADADSR